MNTDEYHRVAKEIQDLTQTRNNILTFSFTSVTALLALAFTSKVDNPLMYLLPFFLIVPFCGRHLYYRMMAAHKTAFLEIFFPEKMVLSSNRKSVPIRPNWFGLLPAFLINFELFFLCLACSVVFYLKNQELFINLTLWNTILIIAPAFASLMVFSMCFYAKDYTKWVERYKSQWNKVRQIQKQDDPEVNR